MANFPIGYSTATPSGKGQNVPWNINVSTGAEYIAQGVEKLGGAMFEVGQKIQKAQDAMQLSDLNRQRNELTLTTSEELKKITDKDTGDKVIADYEVKSLALANKANNRVQFAYNENYNNSIIQRRTELQGVALHSRAKDARSQFDFQYADLLSKGKSFEAQKILETALATEIIEQPEYKARAASMPNDMSLSQAWRAVGNGNLQLAQSLTKDLKGLTEPQFKIKEQIDSLVNREMSFLITKFEDNLCGEENKIDQKKDVSPQEVVNATKEMETEIYQSNLPEKDKMRLHKQLMSWSKGEGEIDYARMNFLNEELDRAYRTGIVDPTIKDRINSAKLDNSFGPRGKGGERIYGNLMRRFENITLDSRITAVSEIVSEFRRENADEPTLVFLFEQAKNQWFLDNPEADIKDAFVKVRELKAVYENLSPEQFEQMIKTKGVAPIPEKPLPVIKTKKEYKALPKGTKYKDEKGNIGIKK